jgi:hypothetical protein
MNCPRWHGLVPRVAATLCLLLSLAAIHCTGQMTNPTLPEPPPMPRRPIAPGAEAKAGEQIVLTDRGTNFTLFLPASYSVPPPGEVALTVHFHSAIWFGIQEHLRRGCTNPIVCFYPGEGSSVYRVPFEDRERFGRWLRLVEDELVRRGAPTNTAIASVDISSFSAGYGAVRELVKQPEYRRLLRRVVLCDSIYGSLDEIALKDGRRQVAQEHVQCWLPLAQEAERGERDFVLTVSAIATRNYASSGECANALIAAVGARKIPVAAGSLPAAADQEFPLIARADSGRFHVWFYGGTNDLAHLTHPRRLAEVWQALGEPPSARHPQRSPQTGDR